ncbi:MAG TPA: hypothetical protein VLY23_06960 [Candidatus Acidoferrum sp.]|nr:hypothetical protein [Candidatus Acidoferrum sp.]
MGEGSYWTEESQRIFERAKDFLASEGESSPDGGPTPPDQPPKPHRRRLLASAGRRASPGRHSRKCSVCRHPDRDAIEQEYLDWRSPEAIAESYGISHHSSIYRHAEALGLRGRRNANMRMVLDTIIEQVSVVRVTANAVINAVRASACLTDDGRWVEPQRVIIHRTVQNPNRELLELEHHATH